MSNSFFDDLVVVKRSGQRVSFYGPKIALAIKKAFDSENKPNEKDINKVYESVLNNISLNYNGRKTINVEDIQDIIEHELQRLKYNDIYESFKIYREKRAVSRELCSLKEEHKFAKATTKLIDTYDKSLNKDKNDILINFGKAISLEYGKSYLLESKYSRAHDDGKIFINNLEYFPLGLFESCFPDMSNTNIENILNLSKEINGELAVTNIDKLLTPHVIKKYKELFFKALINNLKVKGIYEYLKIDESILDLIIIINPPYEVFKDYILNDEIKNIFIFTLKNTLEELKVYLKDYLEDLFNRMENSELNIDNKYSVSFGSFEVEESSLINNIILDIIKDNNYKHIKFIYKVKNKNIDKKVISLINDNKDILLVLNNKKDKIEYFSDGSRIYNNALLDSSSALGKMYVGRISINLPLIALKNKNNAKSFYNELSETLEFTKNALISLFEFKANRYRMHFKYLFKDDIFADSEKVDNDQKIRKVLKQGILGIELSGLFECAYVMNSDKVIDTALLISSFAKKKLLEYSEEEKLNFALMNIENEKAYESFLSINKSIYGIVKNVTDGNYNVFDTLSFDEICKLLCKFDDLYNGGYKASLNKKYLKDIDKIINSNLSFIKFRINKKDLKL